MTPQGKRTRLRDRLEYFAARSLLFVLEWTPRPISYLIARTVTKLLDLVLPRLRRTGLSNLEFAMPQRSLREREQIIDGVFRSIARLLVSFVRFPKLTPDNVGKWIRYEGFEHFTEGLKRGRGVLFYTAHLGNWELSAVSHALMAQPMHIVVRPLDNALVDVLASRYRSATGNHLIEKKDARPILKALSKNEAVGILADQNAGLDDGVFVDFFGRPACAHPGFARIAAHSRAVVIPGFALWSVTENRYVLRFYPPVEMTGDAVTDTQLLHRRLESVIREYPDQWLWIHRRWKTRPPGE